MDDGTRLSTWVSSKTKGRFSEAAACQGLSESALLRRLIEQMLASGGMQTQALSPPADQRDARVTIRLVAEDRALLRERAAARPVPAAPYISYLVRAHLRGVAPLTERELSALRASVGEFSSFARTLGDLSQQLQRGGHPRPPGQQDVLRLMQICDVVRDRFRSLIKAHLESWTTGHGQ